MSIECIIGSMGTDYYREAREYSSIVSRLIYGNTRYIVLEEI